MNLEKLKNIAKSMVTENTTYLEHSKLYSTEQNVTGLRDAVNTMQKWKS